MRMKSLRAQAAIEWTSLRTSTAGSLKGQAAIESAAPTARRLRGQAAMEYLVTYGWALLALFAVIAILLSSGAFSTNSFSVQECTFQPDLPCVSYILYRENTAPATVQTDLKFTLTNGLGFPIKILNVTYVTTDIGQQGRVQWAGSLPTVSGAAGPITGSGIVQSGDKMSFSMAFPGDKQPLAKDFKTVYVTFSFANCKGAQFPATCDGAQNYTTSGRIAAAVEGT